MLLERIDELPLAQHDLRGNPSALLGAVVGRIDRLKDELITADDYARLGRDAARGHDATAPRRARARVRRDLRHPRPDAGRGRDARLRRPRPARVPRPARAPARARAAGRSATGTCSSTSSRTRTSPRACCCGCSPPTTATSRVAGDDDQAIYRFRGAATKNLRDFEAECPARRSSGSSSRFRCAPAILDAARAVVAPERGPASTKPLERRAPAARSRFWRAPTSARRRRRSRPTSSG